MRLVKTENRFMCIILAVIMALMCVLPQNILPVEAVENTIEITKIVPKYASIELTYATEGATELDVFRSEHVNAGFTKIGTAVNGKFIDHTGTGVIRYYQLRSKDQLEVSNILGNADATGSAALKKNALMFKDVGDSAFDTHTTVDASSDAGKISSLREGSIVLRWRTTNKTDPMVLFIAKTQGESVDANSGTANKASFMLMPNGQLRANFQHTRATVGSGYADGEWHTAAIMNSQTTNDAFRFTVDGKQLATFPSNNGANTGFFSTVKNLNQMTIGGNQSGAEAAITNGFQGDIDYVLVTDEVLSTEEANTLTNQENGKLCDISDQMFNQATDNTWVFTGGTDVEGGYAQTKGIRNYIGQFEEYVRWTKSNNNTAGKQRYVINTGKVGNTMADVIANFETLVSKYDPKALSVLIGEEEYLGGEAGISSFKTNLQSLVMKALTLREQTGYFVIQTPYAQLDVLRNTQAALYTEAIQAVYESLSIQQKQKVLVVNHYQLTNNEQFKTKGISVDGHLNAYGHLEIAKEFSKYVFGTVDGFPVNDNHLNLVKTQSPELYLQYAPIVTAFHNRLSISIPEQAQTQSSLWKYKLEMNGQSITGAINGQSIVLSELPHDEKYTLIITSEDGVKQLLPVTGLIKENDQAIVKSTMQTELTPLQQQVQELLLSKDSATWLFAGDSITHGALHTSGYDSIHQSFEKYVHDDMNRQDDVVINTAVSGATTTEQEANSYNRLDKYDADVVVVMLGTNDAPTTVSLDQYRANLNSIVDKIHEKKAIAVLRTPNPLRGNDLRAQKLIEYVKVIREVARDKNAILVDHYAEWSKELETRAYLWENGYWNNDAIHPNANGQLNMAQSLLYALGIANEASPLYKLAYEMPNTKENSNVAIAALADGQTISVNLKALAATYGSIFGKVTLQAECDGIMYSAQADRNDEELSLRNLPGGRVYQVRVIAELQNVSKRVTFKEESVALLPVIETYKVTFLGKEGNLLDEQIIEKGGDAVAPQAPTLAGYVFEGWDKEFTNVQEDMIVQAIYVPVEQEDTSLMRTILATTIAKVESIIAEGKLHDVVSIVAETIRLRLAEAKEVIVNESATNIQLLEAWQNLADAIQYLDFTANKTMLSALIDAAAEINEHIGEYSEGVEAFQQALKEAKKVYDNGNALQASIEEAIKNLEVAIDNLVKENTVNKHTLSFLVESITTTVGDGSQYKDDENWKLFQEELGKAKALLVNDNATQAAINASIRSLTASYENIRLLPSEEQLAQLNTFMNAVNKMNRTLFSNEQLQMIDEIMERADAMIHNFDAHNYPSLQKAMATTLRMINDVNAKELNNAKGQVTSDVKNANGVSHAATPNTGDYTNFAGVLWTICLSGCGLILIKSRRNKKYR